jgi:hypothetical protein
MFEDQPVIIKKRRFPINLRDRTVLTRVLPAVVLALALIIVFILGRVSAPKGQVVSSSSQPVVDSPKASQNLNKDFDFAVKDDKGAVIGSLKYTLQSADLSDEIVVQGQKVQALQGRVFLIVNLKIVSDNKQNIQMNTRNYVRLSMNGNDSELLAPDIHNDPVEIQAISTKITRIGFAINTSDKNFKLIVGEVDGPKTTIPLTLKNN